MHLLQYRVDFIPEIDHTGVKKAMVRMHEERLGKYVFDGTLLYNTTRLPQVNTSNFFLIFEQFTYSLICFLLIAN